MRSRRHFIGTTAMAAGGLSAIRPLGTLAAEQNSAGPRNAPGTTDTDMKMAVRCLIAGRSQPMARLDGHSLRISSGSTSKAASMAARST